MKKILTAFVLALGLITVSFFYFAVHKTIAPAPKSPQVLDTSLNTSVVVSPKINVNPSIVLQGEPAMISVENVSTSTIVQEISFAGQPIKFFIYKSKPTAFVAIDLSKKVGQYGITAKLTDGTILKNTLTVSVRPKLESPLGIPAKLGGNSTTSQKSLVNNLAKENAVIKALPTASKVYWSTAFQYPIPNPIITDPFGYSRLTGAYTITHLGADLRADVGTPVAAMNRGIVTFSGLTTIYGNMIVIDHGFGLETLYAHLSKINISKGQIVEKGQIIALSGQTGYAEQPHLHISVKINNISVDPIKFLKLFK